MSAPTRNRPGPKGLPVRIWNLGVDLALQGASAKDIARELGIGLTKAYDIFRHPVKKPVEWVAPIADTPGAGVGQPEDRTDHGSIMPEAGAA